MLVYWMVIHGNSLFNNPKLIFDVVSLRATSVDAPQKEQSLKLLNKSIPFRRKLVQSQEKGWDVGWIVSWPGWQGLWGLAFAVCFHVLEVPLLPGKVLYPYYHTSG